MCVSSALTPSVGLSVLKIINVRFSIICVGLLCLYKCSSQRVSRPKRVPVPFRFGPMECLAQCLFRKECKYTHKSKLCHILEYVPHDPPPRKWDTCSDTAFPRSILPKVSSLALMKYSWLKIYFHKVIGVLNHFVGMFLLDKL